EHGAPGPGPGHDAGDPGPGPLSAPGPAVCQPTGPDHPAGHRRGRKGPPGQPGPVTGGQSGGGGELVYSDLVMGLRPPSSPLFGCGRRGPRPGRRQGRDIMTKIRKIKKVWQSQPTLEGAGVRLRRAFGYSQVPQFDPFLLLDDFRADDPADYLKGFPWHPHRGIETITYVLAGEVKHGDSMGNHGAI